MIDDSPKVSIILPTYNGAEYIRQSIDSCLNQTYKNIELITVDDGSTDETPEIIKSYRDKRIKYVRHNRNRGLPHALNSGFIKATGEYLTWTSDDNYYAKEAIEKMVSFSRDKECPFVYCDFYRFNEENPSVLNIVKLPDVPDLENHNDIGACFLYSRKIREVIGDYSPEATFSEDYDYWIRVSKKFSMCHLAEPLYFFREHEGSLSSRFLKQYEIQATSILVRIKNNIIDVERATRKFIDLIVERKIALTTKPVMAIFHFLRVITFRRMGPSFLYRFLAKIRFSKKIKKILIDFQMKRISIENARLSLKNIINSRLMGTMSVDRKEQNSAKYKVEIDLAVCILFYEKLDQTLECIQSILPARVNIYILNNGSSLPAGETLKMFCDNYEQIKIFNSDVNLGVAAGRNYLITHTKEEWLLFVDSDIVIKTPDWLYRFTRYVSLNNDNEVFIPKLFNVQENYYSSYLPFRIVGDNVVRERKMINEFTNNFPGGASFINRKVFERLGLYDDKMFVGLQDYELCIRGIRLGEPVKAQQVNDIEFIHDHRQSKKMEDRKTVLMRYDVNRIRTSLNRIAEKHNLILEGKWETWIADAVEKMLNNDSQTLRKDWRRWVIGKYKWMLRGSRKMAVPFVSFFLPSRVKELLKRRLNQNQKGIPHSCSLCLTDKCNFQCPQCYRSVIGIKRSKEMNLATVQKLMSLYPSLVAFNVVGLGEQTLCSNFVEIVNFLKRSGRFVGIITNGTSLDKLLALDYEPNYVSISLYGYDNESYLANTGVAAYDRVIENFTKVKSKFKNVGFSYILNRTNYKDLDKLLLLCDKLKPEFLHLINYLAYNPKIMEEIQKIITVNDTEIIDYINEMCSGRNYIKVKPIYVDFENQKLNCRSYNYKIKLDGDGNIGGCQRQIPADAIFGNIFRDKDPYNSLKMQSLRELMQDNCYIHDECRYCFGNWE